MRRRGLLAIGIAPNDLYAFGWALVGGVEDADDEPFVHTWGVIRGRARGDHSDDSDGARDARTRDIVEELGIVWRREHERVVVACGVSSSTRAKHTSMFERGRSTAVVDVLAMVARVPTIWSALDAAEADTVMGELRQSIATEQLREDVALHQHRDLAVRAAAAVVLAHRTPQFRAVVHRAMTAS